MRLSELEPHFLRHEEKIEEWTRRKEDGSNEQVTGPRDYYVYVDTLQEANGIEFLCPKCFIENKGPVGTHIVICWQPDMPVNLSPGPGRWKLVGTSFEDLSLVSNPTSVQLNGGCNAHFTVSDGNVGFN
jgi:hypothetical protein